MSEEDLLKNTFCYSSRHHYAWDDFTNIFTFDSVSDMLHWFGVVLKLSPGAYYSLATSHLLHFSPLRFVAKKWLVLFFSFDRNDGRIAIRLSISPLLYLGTILIELASPFSMCCSKPIQANRPHQLGILTTLYITSMGISQRSPLLWPFRSPKPLLGKVWSTSWQPCVLLLWSSGS